MELKVIAFPFAGGNQYSFNLLKKELASRKITLKVLEYPGRGKRIREPLLHHIDDLIEDAYKNIPTAIKEDNYVIYGHSLGALVGCLICKKIEENGLKKPIRLAVSGSKSPGKEMVRDKISHLPSNVFWRKISEYGGVPEEILKEENIKTFFEPVLRADFKIIENYHYTKQEKITVPIDVFFGTEEGITRAEALAWQNETTEKVTVTPMEGDHFFIYKHQETFLGYFTKVFTNLTH